MCSAREQKFSEISIFFYDPLTHNILGVFDYRPSMIEGDGGLNLHPPAIQGAPNGTEVDHIPKERKDVSFQYNNNR